MCNNPQKPVQSENVNSGISSTWNPVFIDVILEFLLLFINWTYFRPRIRFYECD